MGLELAEMAEIETVESGKIGGAVTEENKGRVVEVNRVVSAVLHFNEQDPRAKWLRDWLRRRLILVGRAERQALELLKTGLRLTRDEKEIITRAELLIPAASVKDTKKACELLLQESSSSVQSSSARRLAQPVYSNSYRLVEVVKQEDVDFLRFVLLEKYSYIADSGKQAGQEVIAVTKLPIKFLQRIITRWLRPTLFDELPPILKNGAAQEVAQTIGSHLGLNEEGSQAAVGFPSMDGADPRLAREQRHRFKVRPGLFVNSGDTAVYVRKWTEAGRSRVGLYVALPLAPEKETFGLPTAEGHKDVKTNPFRWWRDCLDQFTVLPAWPDKRLKRRSNVSLIPLHCKGGLRRLRRRVDDWESREHSAFIRALSGKDEICWSRIVYRDGEFILQITVKRSVQPIARPNILGVHIGQIQVEGYICHCLVWAYTVTGAGNLLRSGLIKVDRLPIGSEQKPRWAGREERRRSAYDAARKVVALADKFNADLAIEEVWGVKKRGRGQGLRNLLGTRFNFSDLARFISDKALDHPRPVRVWRVLGFKVLEEKKQGAPPQRLAELVADEGWQIRERILSRH